MSRKIAKKSLGMRPLAWVAIAAATLAITACSSDQAEVADAGAPADVSTASTENSTGLMAGGLQPGGKFRSSGSFAAKGSPDLNTVPTTAPQPTSSKEDRARALEGLIADRANARYTDQGGRTQPVAVRPLVDTPEVAAESNAVARLDDPAPERPPEEPAFEALPPPIGVQGDVGPQAPGIAPRRGGDAISSNGALTSASLGGFNPLAEFQAAVYSNSTQAGTVTAQGGSLSSSERKLLNTTARQQIDSRGKAVVRMVGHGNGGLERALIAARELERLGVSSDNIYVGVDNINGPVEVFLDRSK